MNKIRLVDLIDNENFDPILFGGYIYNDLNFIKYFTFFKDNINDTFIQINEFLVNNGYNPFDFHNKWNIDGIENELMSAYVNPYYIDKDNANIILVIYRKNK
jgi:hypothetical protein